MKKMLSFVVLMFLSSCFLVQENGIKVEVLNNSDNPIKNIKFYTTEKYEVLKFKNINAGENAKGFLSMHKNKTDGGYILEFERKNGKKENVGNGYYTNGGSLDRKVIIEIKNDTIKTKFNGPDY